MAPKVLGYWDIRGLGEPIRYLLAHAGVPYEDKRYSYGKGPEPSRDEWLAEKYKLDLDFPNLPYLIDGDVRMTQSQAILRYLGRKLGLVPKDEETLRRVDMLEHQVVKTLGPSTFRKGYPVLEEYCQRVAALPGLKQYLASDRFKPWPIWSPYAKALSAHSKPPADDC
ncbi:glutathione S-transferase Mu 6 [Dermacentor silvarum]|uniref:glutathione S-transferase Mu 6 n=1 Tax=Dermacentor silvarum TaxID=543639 RepID=UPI00210156A7|nr:glutathione S-transferase Mu 6 [Dermacentor silvarum]